ncbi:hypothetical protein [Paraferrimonas haliotis]|uniref:Uncharacterized protein n=1 Tax=Paraferrimonas haliotis TaxID=2013866 RepID=A0AA37TLC0_9GAMM|nr:hypothetical protein [Paraferrimonas haliotis]GLS83692.1 hypothetical protein GCM10007894_16690 [Paraferrimonas haliotis]
MARERIITQVLLTLALIATIAVAQLRSFDSAAKDYTDEALVNAGATYAAARILNAGISSLQSVELSVGVASFSPGEMLDPLNDLIERFSWITMMALASLGIQKLGLVIISSNLFNVLLFAAAGFCLTSLWWAKAARYRRQAIGTFALLTIFRFSLAAMALLNSSVEHYFLTDIKQQASIGIEQAASTQKSSTQLQSNNAVTNNNASVLESVQSAWQAAKSSVNGPNQKIQQAVDNIDQAMNSILDMITLFILQTILLPLLFLYGLKRLAEGVIGWVIKES